MAALVGAAADARAGEPRCVVVTGEAGIGKTRLVAEALATLDDARVLTGHAADMTTGEIPFGVLADTLRDLVRQYGSEGLTPTERTVLAPLLPGGTASVSVDSARIHMCALDLLGRWCTDGLLVWLVEDLHWADAATRDLVRLAARTVRGGLLVVVTIRTDDPARAPEEEGALNEQLASLLRVPHATRVDLRRLTPDQIRDLVRSLPHTPPTPTCGPSPASATECRSSSRSSRPPRGTPNGRPRPPPWPVARRGWGRWPGGSSKRRPSATGTCGSA